jgi:hypothetical protein
MPEPEEPAGTKPGLQELSGTKNGSPGGRQTRSKSDALLRVDESGAGKPKSSVEMPKGIGSCLQLIHNIRGSKGLASGLSTTRRKGW